MPFNVSWSVIEADSLRHDRVDDPIPSAHRVTPSKTGGSTHGLSATDGQLIADGDTKAIRLVLKGSEIQAKANSQRPSDAAAPLLLSSAWSPNQALVKT
jgi:hypothetical protein